MTDINAHVALTDEIYYLKFDGQFYAGPDYLGSPYLTKEEITTESQGELEKWVAECYDNNTKILSGYYTQSIQKVVVDKLTAPPARLMATMDAALRDREEREQLPELAAMLYTTNIGLAIRSIAKKVPDLGPILDNALNNPKANSDIITEEELSEIVRTEVANSLKQQLKLTELTLHGDAMHPVTDDDVEGMVKQTKAHVEKMRECIPQTVTELKSRAISNSPRTPRERQTIMQSLATTPGMFGPQLGSILEVPLTSEEYEIKIVPEILTSSHSDEYCSPLIKGEHRGVSKSVYIALEKGDKMLAELSSSELRKRTFGRDITGVFAPVMDYAIEDDVKKSFVDGLPTERHAWAEELAHAGLDAIFHNQCMPFDKDDPAMEQAFREALDADKRYNPGSKRLLGGGYDLSFETVAVELPVKLAYTFNEDGSMEAFRKDSPNLCKYFEDYVIPRARKLVASQSGGMESPG